MSDNSRLLAGRYRLGRLLGRGGMGQVWEARDEMLGRAVAVKEIRFPVGIPDDERDILCERTMREARLTARLSHPGIVTVYDVASVDGSPFIVMELVPSHSLADEIDRHGPLPSDRVATIGLALLDALAVAHQEGVIHRDVKPSNVLLGESRVVLTDFGIATSESDATLTSTGLLIGSPTYMSPERLRSDRIGPPADIWSLGATLYAALEGHPPFRSDTTMGTITAVLTDPAPEPHVPGPLRDALLGMFEKSPELRLTGAQVRPLLQQAMEAPSPQTAHIPPSTPVMAPSGPPEPPLEDFFVPAEPASAPRRRPGLVPLLVAVVLALVAGGLVLASQLGGGDDPSAAGETTQTGRSTRGNANNEPSPDTAETTKTTKPPETTETTETTEPPEQGPRVPDGYTYQRDPQDFSVAIPQGWERREVTSFRVDFVSPDGGRYLRVEQQAQAGPSAEQAWLDLEPAVADRLPGYQRIRIEPIDYRYPAADWEFTWEGSGGTVHVLNRGIVTDPRGFALYMSGPDATWETESLPVLEAASASFRPR